MLRSVTVFFRYYASKLGASALVELIDQIQANMFGMVIERVFISDRSKAAVSQLTYAQAKLEDLLVNVSDGRKYLADSINKLSQSRPVEVSQLRATAGVNSCQALQKYCNETGVRIIYEVSIIL
uniref:Exportin-2 C-terminal domain-containing protein n=1 Tax=Glossina palpalis gambiensis TaxID=67801 RepID=A0A1B0C196_9MUSC